MLETPPPPATVRRADVSATWLTGDKRSATGVAAALEGMRRAPAIIEAMRGRASLVAATEEAVRQGNRQPAMLELLEEAIADELDTVTALAAVHALARLPGPSTDERLGDLVLAAEPAFSEHAAAAARWREGSPRLADSMARAIVRGGRIGMHAQESLLRWASRDPELAMASLLPLIDEPGPESSRRHLVETIGSIPGPTARMALQRVAGHADEAESVRATAIAAFAGRSSERLPRSIGSLSTQDALLGYAVRTVRAQRQLTRRGPRRAPDRSGGLRVAQIHLGAVIDESMSHAGRGDTGGVATLLSHLGTALAAQPRVAEVVTVGRGRPGQTRSAERHRGGHRFEQVDFYDDEGASFSSPWPSLLSAQRGIRAALLASGVPDVVHLRMADPGSVAGSRVAGELGIPTVFTLAPDPHVLIDDAERSRNLDRASFARADARAALWFRVDVVMQLAAHAREVVVFPRPAMRQRLRELVGVDIAAGPPRYTVVAEGVDTRRTDTASGKVMSSTAATVLSDIDGAISALPPLRHGLPMLVSVGRMHEVKGMARVVEAFVSDRRLMEMANLVLVGGDLADPNHSEVEELGRIRAILARDPAVAARIILLGHRSNDDVALVLAAARHGWSGRIGPGGAYVCGSRKEEFGLAIVEAMAAGLPVVVPREGGPASYVEPGVTGVIVDTVRSKELAVGMRSALQLSSDPQTARRARQDVERRFTLERMAQALTAVYRVASGPTSLSQAVASEVAA